MAVHPIRTIQSVACVWSADLYRALGRLSRRKVLTCLLMAALPMAIRIVALRKVPIPEPLWDDEYSYLLGADTLASGRLANPPHPMWVHFETMHVNWLPTYATKFPPGQPLFLALGQRFLGHPWFGVWISFGLMCAALCWMLQGWMPPLAALLGTLVGMAALGIFRYWMDSYCGGAVPAMGGCLVVGAAARLARRTSASAAALGSAGLMLLAASRPFEGIVVSLAAAIVLVWWRWRTGKRWRGLFTARTLVPFAAICGLSAAWLGYYNYKVTGSPLLLPYVANNRMYGANPQFWLLPDVPIPEYRHEIVRKIWAVWTRNQYLSARHNPLVVVLPFLKNARFFWSPILGFLVLAGLLLARSREVWLAVAVVAALCTGLLLEVGIGPHYFAPGILLLLVPIMYAVRWLRIAGQRHGPMLVLLLVGIALIAAFRHDSYHDPEVSQSRRKLIDALTRQGGRHVVLVRYAPGDDIPTVDLAYNGADIDGSTIIWARYMGEERDRALAAYYPDRTFWIVQADTSPLKLLPYDNLRNGEASR